MGHARIPGVLDKEASIRNLSLTGCHIQSTENIDKMKIGKHYTIEIKAKNFFKNYKFNIKAECIWMMKTGRTYEIGFKISSSLSSVDLKTYVDFITSHSTIP